MKNRVIVEFSDRADSEEFKKVVKDMFSIPDGGRYEVVHGVSPRGGSVFLESEEDPKSSAPHLFERILSEYLASSGYAD